MSNKPNNKNLDYLDFDEKGSSGNTRQTTFKVQETPKSVKALRLNDEGKYDEALTLIDNALKEDKNNFENLNAKGIILNSLSEYEKSIECFNRALVFNGSDAVKINKADALYNWAKVNYFPILDYYKAINLIDEALETLPESEDPCEYWFLKAEILESLESPVEARIYYLKAEGEFERAEELSEQFEFIKSSEDALVTVSGVNFYEGLDPFKEGLVLDLVKEKDNEHDADAISVCLDGKKLGYVANSHFTVLEGVKSASDIKFIKDDQKAEVVFIYYGIYVILRLI